MAATPLLTGPPSDPDEGSAFPSRALDGEPLFPRIGDVSMPSAPSLDRAAAGPPVSPTAAPARIDQIMSQITASLATRSNSADRAAPIEIALDPPELGQVRISVARGDDGMVLNLTIDRPETLDLMRRHASLLAQEFQRHGLENSGFTFSGRDGEPATPGRHADNGPGGSAPEGLPDAAPLPPARHTDGTGLDIRI